MYLLNSNKQNNIYLSNELKNNKPIIIPTDTNYNLACLPTSTEAIDLIFEYKKRNKDKPLSLFFSKREDWIKYGKVSNINLMNHLVSHFWPGPLNIIVENITKFNYMLNGNTSIALGCVQNSDLTNLMNFLNEPLAITSANISGTANDLLINEEIAMHHMGDKVKYMLKNSTPINTTKSSTIISLLHKNKIVVIREGDISIDQLRASVSNLECTIE